MKTSEQIARELALKVASKHLGSSDESKLGNILAEDVLSQIPLVKLLNLTRNVAGYATDYSGASTTPEDNDLIEELRKEIPGL